MPKTPIAKFPMEEKLLLAGEPLAANATRSWSSCFPVGKGAGETWERIRIQLHLAMTAAGVWTFPVHAGAYNFIRRITLVTSDGETLVDAPGTALLILNRYLEHHMPWFDPFVVACTGLTFNAVIDIPLGFSNLRKPEDGYLDSGAYSGLTLTITTGTNVVAGAGFFDLGVGNAGANAQVATFDLSIIRTKAGMFNNEAVKPLYVPYIKYIGSLTPSNTVQRFNIESAPDLALFGFGLCHGAVARAPFDHVTAATGLSSESDAITAVTFGDNIIPNIVDRKQLNSFQTERHRDFNEVYPVAPNAVPNIPTVSLIGKYFHNFVPDGSVYGAYPTANKSECYITYAGGGAGTNTVDCLLWGFRTKRRVI